MANPRQFSGCRLVVLDRELHFQWHCCLFPKDIAMQGFSWISLFERIPAKFHDTLALTLVTGAEIMMQSILRLEQDFAILRGRMAGSTDAGRVIVLPYNQIVNLAFVKRMLEADVKAIFGDIMVSAAAPAATAAAAEAEAAQAAGAEESPEEAEAPTQGVAVPMRTVLNERGPAAAAPTAPTAKNQAAPPSKSVLLARLRARLAEQGK
jgi:hypothetical protein